MTSQDRWLLWQCTIMEKIIQLLQCPPHLNPLSFSHSFDVFDFFSLCSETTLHH